MPIELTETQQRALDTQKDEPMRLVDPRTRNEYVLIPSLLFDEIQELLQEEQERKAIASIGLQSAQRWAEENAF